MKFIFSILTSLALLPITGCVFPGNRDHADDRNRLGDEHLASGGDHEEYPGDMDHEDDR